MEQIVALKLIGVPLKAIPILRSTTAAALADALRAQQRTLEEKRNLLDQAIVAIGEVEERLRAGTDADIGLFRRIIEVIEMQNNSEEWKKKYDALLQTKIERLKSLPPEGLTALRKQWAQLVAEIQQELDQDPAGPRAQALLNRWRSLFQQLMGGPIPESMLNDATAAYPDTKTVSPEMRQYADRIAPKDVWDFMQRASAVQNRP